MTPPRRNNQFVGVVRDVISERPGRTFDQLSATSGLFPSEIASAINTLGGAVEIRNGKFYLRSRKPKRRPGLWSRLLDWLLG
jgi:hypothetical protein